MRRFICTLVLGLLLALSSGAVAGAAKVGPVDAAVYGTYSYRDPAGFKVTVGYICPGSMTIYGIDPYANYYAYVSQGRGGGSIMRHAPWKLDLSLQELWGVHLSDRAYEVLSNDYATISCS